MFIFLVLFCNWGDTIYLFGEELARHLISFWYNDNQEAYQWR